MLNRDMKNTMEGIDIHRYVSIGIAASNNDPNSIKPPISGKVEWNIYNSMIAEIEKFKEIGINIKYEIPIDFD